MHPDRVSKAWLLARLLRAGSSTIQLQAGQVVCQAARKPGCSTSVPAACQQPVLAPSHLAGHSSDATPQSLKSTT